MAREIWYNKNQKNIGINYGEDKDGTTASQHLKSIRVRNEYNIRNEEQRNFVKNDMEMADDNPNLQYS